MDDGVNSVERRNELVNHVNILKDVLEKRERRSEQAWENIMDIVKGPIQVVEVSNNEELQALLNRDADK